MKQVLMVLVLAAGGAAWAQMNPVGAWHSIDDKTGEIKAEIRLTEVDGVVSGRIEKLLRKGAERSLCGVPRLLECRHSGNLPRPNARKAYGLLLRALHLTHALLTGDLSRTLLVRLIRIGRARDGCR